MEEVNQPRLDPPATESWVTRQIREEREERARDREQRALEFAARHEIERAIAAAEIVATKESSAAIVASSQEAIRLARETSEKFADLNKKVSKLLTGSPEDTTVPFPIYKCDSCGHINKGFNPFEETEETKLTLND